MSEHSTSGNDAKQDDNPNGYSEKGSKRRNSLFDLLISNVNFIETLALTVIIPFLMAYALSKTINFGNIFYTTLLVFSLSLMTFHLLIRSRRETNTSTYLKSLDYIYLGVAALGLFSTIELARTDLTSNYNYYLSAANDLIASITKENDESIKYYCENEPELNLCNSEREYARSILLLLNNNHFTRLSDYKLLTDKIKNYKFHGKEPTNHRINVFAANAIEQYASIAPNPDDIYLPKFSKNIGYLLLASALALRLTRVTAEIRKWHQ